MSEPLTPQQLRTTGIDPDTVHPDTACAGRACIVHNPTGHHMQDWRLWWRFDRHIFERICPHGIGHPDPDQEPHWRETGQPLQAVHGCDGCCSKNDETSDE